MIGNRHAWLCLTLLAWTVGCERGDTTSGEAPPDSTAVAEVRPLVDPAHVSVRPSFELSRIQAARADLRQPRDIAIDGSGTLYALDFQTPDHEQIVAFDAAGTYERRFGERDNRADRIGPSTQFSLSPWNYVMFVDGVDNALTSFLTMGTYVSSASLGGIGMAVHSIPDFGHFYLKKWDPPRRRAYVLHMQMPLDSLAMVYEVSLPPGQSVRKDVRDVSFLTTSDDRGHLYVAFSDVYRVRVLDRTGGTVGVIESARPAVAKSPREMELERERLLERLQRQVGDVSDSLLQDAARPDSLFPLIEELVVDPGGRLWVRTHRPQVATGTAYDVFNERGELISWVAIPAEVRETAFAPDGRLFVIDERDPDEPTIRGYEVEFGTPAPPDSSASSAAGG